MAPKLPPASIDTILTFDNRDNQSAWSVEWSTTNIPGMDNALGSEPRRRHRGRRRLRTTALALCSCFAMHCRVVTPALTAGPLYYLFLAAAVTMLANPLRHFEVYLGQWSISGPGRAFRVLPMLDGIGLAMCITSIIRAINYTTLAAITMLYVVHSSSDSKLPFTYCRNWDLKAYDPLKQIVTVQALDQRRFINPMKMKSPDQIKMCAYTERLQQHAWRRGQSSRRAKETISVEVQKCNETYHGEYPLLYSPPAYNYFYVELLRLSPTYCFGAINVPLLICQTCIWVFLWCLMIAERVIHGRLVWNNLYTWIVCVPWIWVACLLVVAIKSVKGPMRLFKQMFRIGRYDFFTGFADALVISLYIHSASTGTEIIHGKGLNFYASGHIDPLLNSDNVWHSGLVLALTALHAAAASVCAAGDAMLPDVAGLYHSRESTLWVLPMYSQCTSHGNYSHALSCIIFGGMCFSYIVVAYSLMKTSIHTIFEYRVKLVFVEQQVVAALMCSCLLLSLPYATSGGLALLESVDDVMTVLAIPLVCVMEMVAMVYVYRSSDFHSDINVATEENACNTRISTSWKVIPVLVALVLIGEIVAVCRTELPTVTMGVASAPLLATVLAVPLRALHNAIVFMHPTPRRGV